MMRLSEFIDSHHDQIIAEWVAFARTLLPWAEGLSETDLRDHAEELLTAVADDMRSPQSARQRAEKSKGNAADGALGRVGERHAVNRLDSGLGLDQVVSEYRALRASVLKLWENAQRDEQGEVTRFNEAIDETLATSIASYSEKVQSTRDQFLDILSHDLRNPIGAVTMGATILATSDDPDTAEIASRILASGQRMERMVRDLLDLTRTRLGSGIPVSPTPMDLAAVCRDELAELQDVHPGRRLRFEASGDLRGEWDGDRLAQVVSNLVANALQYGAPDRPVTLRAEARGDAVLLGVHNFGSPIPENAQKTIFAPMTRHRSEADRNKSGLGLGLHIASEIVVAHGGKLAVTSTAEGGTNFTVTLPRRAGPAARGEVRPPTRRDTEGAAHA